jgi:release factor glutamine methyltransferase
LPGALNARFERIICNPPYITQRAWHQLDPGVRDYEPRLALVGGDDGLDCYRAIIPALGSLLAPHALVAFEIGYDQGEAVCKLMKEAGLFDSVWIRQDLAGHARAVVGSVVANA